MGAVGGSASGMIAATGAGIVATAIGNQGIDTLSYAGQIIQNGGKFTVEGFVTNIAVGAALSKIGFKGKSGSPSIQKTPIKTTIVKNIEESKLARSASNFKDYIVKETKIVSEKNEVGGIRNSNLFKVSDSALNHSNMGDFTYNPKNGNISKMKGGGHGQANIDFLNANGLKYEIVDIYPNGVRVGNVADHKVKGKRTGTNQSWFPEGWSESDIVKAGEYVGNLKENIDAVDGVISYGKVNGVRVGVIRTNGEISTIFPDATKQP